MATERLDERRRNNWSWLLPLLIALLALWALWPRIKGNQNSTSSSSNSTSQNQNTKAALTDLNSITSTQNTQDLNDRVATLNNLSVKSVGVNDKVFWVNDAGATNPGVNQGRDLLVYISPQIQEQLRTQGLSIKDGMKANISGTVKTVPSVQDMKTNWQLNDNDANYVKDKGVYLDASSANFNP